MEEGRNEEGREGPTSPNLISVSLSRSVPAADEANINVAIYGVGPATPPPQCQPFSYIGILVRLNLFKYLVFITHSVIQRFLTQRASGLKLQLCEDMISSA